MEGVDSYELQQHVAEVVDKLDIRHTELGLKMYSLRPLKNRSMVERLGEWDGVFPGSIISLHVQARRLVVSRVPPCLKSTTSRTGRSGQVIF